MSEIKKRNRISDFFFFKTIRTTKTDGVSDWAIFKILNKGVAWTSANQNGLIVNPLMAESWWGVQQVPGR